MLSPSPLSLCCVLLLCLPVALLFTTTTTHGPDPGAAMIGHPTSPTFIRPRKNRFKLNILTAAATAPPPPPQDDDALLRVAARVKRRPKPPKKLAFLFLTTTSLHFAPLWELYFNSTPESLYNVYVHADPTHSYDTQFSGIFAGRVIHSKPTIRFSPTLVSAARRLLAHALLHDPSNAMFALLSASCIPLRSFNFTYETLISSNKSFIEVLNNEVGSYDRWTARGDHVMLPEVPFESFRVGSQFWVLTRKHARMVVGDRRLWSKFGQPCVRWDTCYPEENYFPTLMHVRETSGYVPATLTHVDWSGRSDGHPRTYEASEVGLELITRLRSERPRYGYDNRESNGADSSVARRHDPFLFARKFSPECLQVLMSMGNDVIFKD